MNRKVTVEICVGDLESALAAGQGGADRVELCDHLSVGGTTPGAGTIAEACRRLAIPVHVLVRPRGGDFVHSEAELAAMRYEIELARKLGAAGVVIGVLKPDATIDREQTAALVDLARPMSVTFHKAFDQTPDLEQSLDTLIALGVDRVLTSGGRPTALEGIDGLAATRGAVPRPDRHPRRRPALAREPAHDHRGDGRSRSPPRLGRQPDHGRVDDRRSPRRIRRDLERRRRGACSRHRRPGRRS